MSELSPLCSRYFRSGISVLKLLPSAWPRTDVGNAVGFFAQASLELVHEESWESYRLQARSPLARLVETKKSF